jgi:hypothetical protein
LYQGIGFRGFDDAHYQYTASPCDHPDIALVSRRHILCVFDKVSNPSTVSEDYLQETEDRTQACQLRPSRATRSRPAAVCTAVSVVRVGDRVAQRPPR